ncbi:HD domain-containing protein [Aquiflexum sp. LQ15W]|uniref:HD domain-containing protein n=1 Tax=Cognataquiflexum nitidum TaxID=2922272 RepID=UPI001F132CD9|nr:HD domain-containing protein [Cognataquiflexum nitidum]MCH6201396.1 HD domain-containing protein [Cognataquiflexum nitidum]
MKDSLSKEERVNRVFDLYVKFGHADYIGEPVSQIEHMCQSAQLAQKEGYENEVVLAAFFHDLGHLFAMDRKLENMGGFGVKRHEEIGADFLREVGFPEKVAKLVENHVQAKRYLTFKYPEYLQKLSEASMMTLGYQGGVMTSVEAENFEKDPLFDLSLKMRTWDELAKEEQIPVPDLEYLKELALKVIH